MVRLTGISHHLQLLLLSLLLTFPITASGQQIFQYACPRYEDYAQRSHRPLSRGNAGVPYMRPVDSCRLFSSGVVNDLVGEMNSKLKDKDIARLFENCFPNTLDTTIRWHDEAAPETFVITGDINAMWLRDSTFQLQPYLRLLTDAKLKKLTNGAIQTQAKYIERFPYCNAFQPPKGSKVSPSGNSQDDVVHPPYDPDLVFECKYEIDSLSSFLRLSRQYFEATKDLNMFTQSWISAVQNTLQVVKEQAQPSFDQVTGLWNPPYYSFRRKTDASTETLALGGAGYPVNANTSLIRSAFRPSDDSTIYQLFIPGNAMLSVELDHLSKMLTVAHEHGVSRADTWAAMAGKLSAAIRQGIYQHGVFEHPVYGTVFAFEVDGYGGRTVMDDANMPSLLSLPLLGFINRTDPIYQNTRKMVLSTKGNPYYFPGTKLQGIGSPHTPTKNVWPMSLLVQIMTSDDADEITKLLKLVVQSTTGLGLMHESVNAWRPADYTRPWFAWANAMFAMTIFDLEERFPDLILNT